jgi:exosortase
VGSLVFYMLTHVGAELFTMRFSMILVMLSAVAFLAGWKMMKAVLLPFMYLVFMIPLPAIIWNKIAFPLQLFATKLTVATIKWLQISVYGEGNIIYLANTTLEVIDACSGLRSLTSLLALSAAFSLISDHTLIKKWLVFLSAVPIAIFVNIIRLTVTAILSVQYGEKAAQGFLHEVSGLLIFFLALVMLYAFHQLLSKISFSSRVTSQ